jgi:hypothetical protein
MWLQARPRTLPKKALDVAGVSIYRYKDSTSGLIILNVCNQDPSLSVGDYYFKIRTVSTWYEGYRMVREFTNVAINKEISGVYADEILVSSEFSYRADYDTGWIKEWK